VKITLNGTAREVAAGTTVAALMTDLTGSTRGSAAAVDGAVVPRGEWHDYALREGQVVELITAVQGG
jgi:sulfur carrier protein